MTDTGYKPPPSPTKHLHSIPSLGQDASEGSSLAQNHTNESYLSVGPGIHLKGEISNCATVTVEGEVEATLDGEALEILQHGVFCGTARVVSAFIHGQFEGDLSLSGLLRVANGGSASGKLSYGQLEISVGGELSGEIRKFSDKDKTPVTDDTVSVAPKIGQKPASKPTRRNRTRKGGAKRSASE